MSLSDYLKARQRMQDVAIPAAVRAILETQQKIKAALYPSAVQDILDSQKAWSSIFDSNPLKEFKPIIDFPSIDFYSKAFSALENMNTPLTVSDFIPPINFSSTSFDFLSFVDEVTEEESKEVEKVIVEETKSIKRIITDIYQDNSNLLKIEPRQFEELVAELLHSKGYKIELTKQTRDNGYDIIALVTIGGNLPLKFLVECKRLKKDKVGVDIVRSFKEVIQTENANKGIIVTTSYFTKDANKKRLETPYLLDYKDKDDVLQWIADYCNR
ncbi:MAG: restriction endonuclease [Chitinophagaceae bacterium]|nr:restriction endonuclease [Chitinophagaceae bacterium]